MGAAAPDQTAERRALLSAGGVCALWPRHAPSEAGTAAADFGAPQRKFTRVTNPDLAILRYAGRIIVCAH